ncbi:Sigma-70, region 4 [Thalassoglobus neptunius]|uniref:Sigma-70, region 4 n=1 Tax=Thalassoglobus neptunius TaxID=1938619 RepID=A0A5C5VXB0_9PLAN|nr:sigma factor-like helix-turn-helix DNA-binding protein [Thalassoglobus neptunius]TWT43060.1 Sigma-70, region 4 [Thalassoglobus neptunius]
MSIVDRNHVKISVRSDASDLMEKFEIEWAGENPLRWKQLACLHLYTDHGWTLERIGRAFGHPKGHVSRIVRLTADQLRERFAVNWDSDPEQILNSSTLPPQPDPEDS